MAVAAGLAGWLSAPGAAFKNSDAMRLRPQAEIVRAAAPAADTEQVRRAYDEFANVYAATGVQGLARFSESCRQSLAGDPRILDFCLAFDLFAESVRPDGPTAGRDEAQRVAMVRAARPADPAPDRRIADVRRLMRVATGMPAVAPMQADVQKVAAPEPLRIASKPVRAATPTATCRLKSTPADRLVCANSALGSQHRRMRQAYDRALAAGADPLAVDEGQAEWRVARNAAGDRAALAALYARRIGELNAVAAKPHPEAPPT